MNLFLIDAHRCGSTVASGERISRFLSAAGEGERICLLTGYDAQSRGCADLLEPIFENAEICRTHLFCGEAFDKLCLSVELLLERMKSGSLSEFDTIVAPIGTDAVRAVLQCAFYMDVDDAKSINVRENDVRLLSLCGNHFFDLGYLGAQATTSVSAPVDTSSASYEYERVEEDELEQERKHIVTYYRSIGSSRDTVRFIEDTNKKISRIQNTVEQDRILWGNQFLFPSKDYAANNDLLLLCLAMKEIARSMNEHAITDGKSKTAIPENEQEQELELFGITPEKSISDAHGRSNQGHSQNSK